MNRKALLGFCALAGLLVAGTVVVVALIGRGNTPAVVATEAQIVDEPIASIVVPSLSAPSSASSASGSAPASSRTATKTTLARTTVTRLRDEAGLAIVRPAQLPAEAQAVLRLIAAGGPFPFSRDGIVFENREGILPKKAKAYYHEYTVVTPGENDRGARRLIAGAGGERYYTADHYESFVRVLP